jgi:HAMP domain-containing protein
MASAKGNKSGLLRRLMVGVFIPTVIAFLIVAALLFQDVPLGGKAKLTSIKGLGLRSLNELGELILKESTDSLDKLGEKVVEQKVNDVTKQVEIYMKAHPKRSLSGYLSDPTFKEIVLQKFGETGYVSLADSKGIMLLHPNPAAVGTDVHGSQMPEVATLTDICAAKGFSSGYYRWKDPATGKMTNKFIALKNVEGWDMHLGAATSMDEFSRPANAITTKTKAIERKLVGEYNNKFLIFAGVVAIVLVILLGFVYYVASAVVKPIRQLSEIADRISMGDLKAVVKVKGKGEVQALAESIERMQTSVRAAIERLQKRRESGSSNEARQH